jgi:hypothetical protein
MSDQLHAPAFLVSFIQSYVDDLVLRRLREGRAGNWTYSESKVTEK